MSILTARMFLEDVAESHMGECVRHDAPPLLDSSGIVFVNCRTP